MGTMIQNQLDRGRHAALGPRPDSDIGRSRQRLTGCTVAPTPAD
jgi:hypothetical protein